MPLLPCSCWDLVFSCRMLKEKKEQFEMLLQGFAWNKKPALTERLVRFGSLPSRYQRCSEFRILTDLNPFSLAPRLHDLPVTFSNDISLTPFSRSSSRGGNFLTNVSLNPPTQTPTARRDWQKRKKKKKELRILYTLEKMLQAFLYTCDLWNVTQLWSAIIKKQRFQVRQGITELSVIFSSYRSH